MLHVRQLKVVFSFLLIQLLNLCTGPGHSAHSAWWIKHPCTQNPEWRPMKLSKDSFDSFPPFPEFLKNQGEHWMLRGLSTFAGNKVWACSTCTGKRTGSYVRHELGKSGVGSDSCYPSTGEDQMLKVILSYLGSLGPAWGHLWLSKKETKPTQNSEQGERKERFWRGLILKLPQW